MIPMGKIKRELHTNERIGNAIKIFKDITACLEDVLKEPEGAEGLPMTQVCAKHNIDYLNLRKLMEAKTFEKIYTDKVIQTSDIKLPEMDSYERLFRSVFGINKDEIIELPVDYKESIDYVLDKALLERERGIIDARFGFKNKFDDDPVPMTFEEIGSKLGVSRDRIHQIVAKALRKMRRPSYAKILNEGLTKVRLDEEARLIKVKASQKKLAQTMKDLENDIQEISEDKINENYIEDVLKRIPIIDLGLSVRACNCLYRGGLKTIYDFIILSDEQVSKIRNMGIRTRTEIEEKLNQFLSIKFNMKLDDVRKILSIN